jgi:putative transposase
MKKVEDAVSPPSKRKLDDSTHNNQVNKENNSNKKRKLSMRGSVRIIKRTTSNYKKNPYTESIQLIESYLTSDQVSTTKGRGFEPFWNSQCKEISTKLWLPIETDLRDLGSISLSGSSIGTEGGFELSVKMKQNESEGAFLQKLSFSKISSRSLHEDAMEEEEEEQTGKKKKKKGLKMMKVKVYPTKEQRLWIMQQQHNLRALQNAAIAEVKEGRISLGDVRKKMLKSDKGKATENVVAQRLPEDPVEREKHIKKWNAIDSAPYTLRKNCLKNLQDDWFDKLKQLKQGVIKKFDKKFVSKKKKLGRVNIYLEGNAFRDKNTFDDQYIYMFARTKIGVKKDKKGKEKPLYFEKLRYKMQGSRKQRKTLPNPRLHDCQLIYEHPNRWYLLIPYKPETTKIPEKAPFKDISMDPGERGFQNFYSNDAKVVGTIDLSERKARVQKLLNKVREFQSRRDKSQNRNQAQYWSTRFLRTWRKIKDIKLDLHRKVVNFLVCNFEDICIGDFGSSFVQKNKSMNKGVKNQLSFLSHYEFRERLSEYAAVRNITVVPESFTTKTCCKCGSINNNIGSSKVYNCPSCHSTFGRDDNGAVCIRIKHDAGQTEVV